jgi:uncharacterized protein
MDATPEPTHTDDAQALRATLRADLVTAMKLRRPEAVAALRTAIAAIDNAEAVDVPDGAAGVASEHVAGARTGVGSTEVQRRVLSVGEVRALLRAQVEERRTEADRLDAYERPDPARRLRLEADVLGRYLDV